MDLRVSNFQENQMTTCKSNMNSSKILPASPFPASSEESTMLMDAVHKHAIQEQLCSPASICPCQWFGSRLTRNVLKAQCLWFRSMLIHSLASHKMSIRSHTPNGLHSHHHWGANCCNVQFVFPVCGIFVCYMFPVGTKKCDLTAFWVLGFFFRSHVNCNILD